MKKILKYSAWFGILLLFVMIPSMTVAFLKYFDPENQALLVLSIAFQCISAVIFSMLMYGFYLLGKYSKNRQLQVMSILTIIFEVIVLPFSILMELGAFDLTMQIIYALVVLFLTGLILLFTGISILRLKDRLKGLAIGTGVMFIVTGSLLMTILGLMIAIFLFIPVYILMILLLLRASKEY